MARSFRTTRGTHESGEPALGRAAAQEITTARSRRRFAQTAHDGPRGDARWPAGALVLVIGTTADRSTARGKGGRRREMGGGGGRFFFFCSVDPAKLAISATCRGPPAAQSRSPSVSRPAYARALSLRPFSAPASPLTRPSPRSCPRSAFSLFVPRVRRRGARPRGLRGFARSARRRRFGAASSRLRCARSSFSAASGVREEKDEVVVCGLECTAIWGSAHNARSDVSRRRRRLREGGNEG